MSSLIVTMKTFGNIIRTKREEKGMLLRELAARMNIDTALLSKIERGERRLKKNQINKISKVLHLEKEELKAYWMADKIFQIIKDEKDPLRAISVAEEQIKYITKEK